MVKQSISVLTKSKVVVRRSHISLVSQIRDDEVQLLHILL